MARAPSPGARGQSNPPLRKARKDGAPSGFVAIGKGWATRLQRAALELAGQLRLGRQLVTKRPKRESENREKGGAPSRFISTAKRWATRRETIEQCYARNPKPGGSLIIRGPKNGEQVNPAEW